MCYSLEASLSAWLIANSLAIYLFYRNRNYDRWNAGFVCVFSTIQLLEAGLWWTYGTSKGSNSLLTKMILLCLMLQPLAQSYLGYRYTSSEFLKYLSFVYLGVMLWSLYRIGSSSSKDFYSKTNSQSHLVWHDAGAESKGGNFVGGVSPMRWIVPTLYLFGLFVPLFFAKHNRGIPLLFVGGATALYSIFLAKGEEWGSLWCFYAVIYAIIAVFV